MSTRTPQLPLALRWPARQCFADFHRTAGNAAALAAAEALAGAAAAPWLLLSGAAGSGKTHLLRATCQAALAAQRSVRYARCSTLGDADALRALGGCDLLALDDLDALAGRAPAEHALFDLYNRLRAEGGALLLAARAPLPQLPLQLPDLRSRLGACVQATLQPLDEAARRALLADWAGARGLTLAPATLDWLFTRSARDLGSLHALLERADRLALARRQRIGIALLRELLAEES